MSKKGTFQLHLPVDKPVAVHQVQLADGSIVERLEGQLLQHPSTPKDTTHG